MRMQRRYGAATFMTAALFLAACQGGTGASPSEAASADASIAPSASAAESIEESAAPSAGATDFLACEVSDIGGIDDKGFNQNAFAGLERAESELGAEIDFLESPDETAYEANINAHIDQGCDIIVTVGFLLGDATLAAAQANEEQLFAIVDYAYEDQPENIQGLTFKTDEAAMLAGYLSAGISKTGVVGTFGGINIPPVAIFMEGYEAGVNYYNEQNGTEVRVLGWDSSNPDGGTFTDSFEDLDLGRQTAEALMQEGADVIFPVAGPVGFGAAAAVQDNGEAYFIGVDVDQYESAPEFQDVMLSSVMKRIDNAVFSAVEDSTDGSFTEALYTGTLENEGVDLAPFHDFEDEVSDDLKAEIEELRAAIISGEVSVDDYRE